MATDEVVPSNLNLFSPASVLLSTSEFKYEKILTKTTLSVDFPSQLEFTANADKVNYTDLNESFLMIKCKFVKEDRSNIEPNPLIGPVQNLLTSMFKSQDLWINDEKVTINEDNAAYINFLHCFTQSKAAKETYLTTSLYYEDTFSSINACNQSNPQAAAETNRGLKTRAQFFGSSKEVVLIGKMFCAPHNT